MPGKCVCSDNGYICTYVRVGALYYAYSDGCCWWLLLLYMGSAVAGVTFCECIDILAVRSAYMRVRAVLYCCCFFFFIFFASFLFFVRRYLVSEAKPKNCQLEIWNVRCWTCAYSISFELCAFFFFFWTVSFRHRAHTFLFFDAPLLVCSMFQLVKSWHAFWLLRRAIQYLSLPNENGWNRVFTIRSRPTNLNTENWLDLIWYLPSKHSFHFSSPSPASFNKRCSYFARA